MQKAAFRRSFAARLRKFRSFCRARRAGSGKVALDLSFFFGEENVAVLPPKDINFFPDRAKSYQLGKQARDRVLQNRVGRGALHRGARRRPFAVLPRPGKNPKHVPDDFCRRGASHRFALRLFNGRRICPLRKKRKGRTVFPPRRVIGYLFAESGKASGWIFSATKSIRFSFRPADAAQGQTKKQPRFSLVPAKEMVLSAPDKKSFCPF